jgi:hypothetical protein
LAVVATVAACSSPDSTRAGAGGGSPEIGGVPALSLTCAAFPATTLVTAARAIAPSVQIRASDAPGDENDGGRECRYDLYTPGTDLSSADYGMVQILVQVQDTWPDVLLDGKHDAADSRQAFDDDRDSARRTYNGTSENNAIGRYYDVADVGEGAYVEDVVHTDDGGTPTSWNADLDALREPRPYNVHVGVSFVIPQPDQAVPDTSLDTAMRDRSHRDDLAKVLAQAVLTQIDTHK